MGAIMLIEIWERLRGYDKWIQTEATIKSSDLEEVEVGGANSRYYIDQPIDEWGSFCEIVWTDASGKLHTAEYEVSENSPLFQLYDGTFVVTGCQDVLWQGIPIRQEKFQILPKMFRAYPSESLNRWKRFLRRIWSFLYRRGLG